MNETAADPFGAYEWAVNINIRGFQKDQLGYTPDRLPLGDMSSVATSAPLTHLPTASVVWLRNHGAALTRLAHVKVQILHSPFRGQRSASST